MTPTGDAAMNELLEWDREREKRPCVDEDPELSCGNVRERGRDHDEVPVTASPIFQREKTADTILDALDARTHRKS